MHESSGESNEVFGGEDGDKCRCHWLIPVPARFPAGEAAARIFGYYCINRNGTLDGLGFAGGGSGETVATSGREGINSVIASRLDNMEMAEYGELSTVENALEPRGDSAEAGRARHNGVDERDSGRGELAMSAV